MNGCQNCILRLQRNDSRKNWCWGKKVTVFITFEIYSKYVRRFCEKVRHGCQNCISRLQMIIPRKKNKSLEYPIILIFFREIGRPIHGVWWGSFRHGCQNCFLHVRKTNSKKNLMLGKKVYCFYHFWILIKICSVFCEKVSARWSKLHFTSTDDHSEKEE